MLEIVSGLILFLYVMVGFIYSLRMNKNKALRETYKAKTDDDWSDICFAVGFAWPFGPFINMLIRRQ